MLNIRNIPGAVMAFVHAILPVHARPLRLLVLPLDRCRRQRLDFGN